MIEKKFWKKIEWEKIWLKKKGEIAKLIIIKDEKLSKNILIKYLRFI